MRRSCLQVRTFILIHQMSTPADGRFAKGDSTMLKSSNRPSTASVSIGVVLAIAGTAQAALPSFQQAITGSQPVLYYQLNETSGPAINHGSLGATHNADWFGTIRRGVPTAPGGDAGAFFDSVDDYLESITAAPASLIGNPAFSAEAVVAVECTAPSMNYPPLLHWGQGGNGKEVYFSLRANDPNHVFFGFYNGGLRTLSPTPVGQWMHLVWTRAAGGNASQGSILYINGQVAATVGPDTFLCCNTQTPIVASTTFRINRGRDPNPFMTGEIDEVALYDRVLSAAEVAAHFAALAPTLNAGLGDLNCDGFVNAGDMDGFVTALLNPADYPLRYPTCHLLNGDYNTSASVTIADISPFVQHLLSGPATTAIQQAIQSDQPLLHYAFNEGTGITLNRGSLGAAYDATIFGSPNLVLTPSGDGGLHFNGVSDYLSTALNVPASLTGNPTFTAEAVFITECTAANYPTFLGWGTAATSQEVYFGLQFDQADRLYCGFYNAGLTSTESIPPAQWLHLVWVRQGGGNAVTGSTVYLNGQVVAMTLDTILCCSAATTPNVQATPFRINRGSNLTRFFVGGIDEVALYDHVLTPAQVLEHYNALPH